MKTCDLLDWFCARRGEPPLKAEVKHAVALLWEDVLGDLTSEDARAVLARWHKPEWPSASHLRALRTQAGVSDSGSVLVRREGAHADHHLLSRWPQTLDKLKLNAEGELVHRRVLEVEIWWRPCRVFLQDNALVIDPRHQRGRRVSKRTWRLTSSVLIGGPDAKAERGLRLSVDFADIHRRVGVAMAIVAPCEDMTAWVRQGERG